MPAPTVATYSLDTLIAAHTALKTVLDSGGSAGSIKIRSAADVLLAQVPLAYPCGTVSGTTGQLTLAIAGPDTSADAGGTAAYAEVCTSSGAVKLALPTQAGTVAVPGYLVLSTLTVVASGPVEVVSAVIG